RHCGIARIKVWMRRPRRGKRRQSFVSRAALCKLARASNGVTNVRSASRLLGIGPARVRELIDAGVLHKTILRGPGTHIDRKEIQELIGRIVLLAKALPSNGEAVI